MKIKHCLLQFIFLFFVQLSSHAQVFNVDTLLYNGDPSNRINIIIMGDGYTINDTAKFRTDAASVITYFFNTPPFDHYKNYFNFFGIEVISNQSGTDHPVTAMDEGQPPLAPLMVADTYLETSFDFGLHRLVSSNNMGLVYTVGNTNFPQYDMLNVIVNTPYYGGSGGPVAFSTMDPAGFDVFMHEFGHSFALLSDEYDYGSTVCQPGNYQGINVTQETDSSILVWKKWLTTAPIPTPMDTACNLIGLYTGANYCYINWYRPKCECKMRSLFQPFCEICAEQLIYKINSLVNLNDNYSPIDTTITLCNNQTQLFTVSQVTTIPNTVQTQWLVDGTPVLNNDTAFVFDPALFTLGNHIVTAISYDSTAMVKKALTSYQQQWNINNVYSNGLSFTLNSNTLISPYTQNQWFIVGNPNPVSTSDTMVCNQSGNYYVTGILNGCMGTSDTTYITCTTGLSNVNSNRTNVQVIPNPFTNSVHIFASGLTSLAYQINLTNVFGQVLQKQEATAINGIFQAEINTTHLSKGIYFLIISNDNTGYYQKIIKNE